MKSKLNVNKSGTVRSTVWTIIVHESFHLLFFKELNASNVINNNSILSSEFMDMKTIFPSSTL
jgi:hypothetical protein